MQSYKLKTYVLSHCSFYNNNIPILIGGYDTLEELLEVITWTQLGIHDKPVSIQYKCNAMFKKYLKVTFDMLGNIYKLAILMFSTLCVCEFRH